jgi:hypothetical protein
MLKALPLALVKPLGKAVSATVTVTNDDGTTETQTIDVAQIDALTSCEEKFKSVFDWWTAGFAGLGLFIGLVTDREDIGFVLPILGAAARNKWTADGQCQSVWNALADVFVAGGVCQATQMIRTGRSIWTGKKK